MHTGLTEYAIDYKTSPRKAHGAAPAAFLCLSDRDYALCQRGIDSDFRRRNKSMDNDHKSLAVIVSAMAYYGFQYPILLLFRKNEDV